MPRSLLFTFALFVMLLTADTIGAAPVDITHYRTRIRTPLAVPASLNARVMEMEVDITETARFFHFAVTNDTAIASAMNVLFFEKDLGQYMNFGKAWVRESDGVNFRRTIILKGAPGPKLIDWSGHGASFRADSNIYEQKILDAVNSGSGEELTISFRKRHDATLDDVLSISTTTGRVVAHFRNVGGINVAADLVVQPSNLPEPASLLLLALGVCTLLGGRALKQQ